MKYRKKPVVIEAVQIAKRMTEREMAAVLLAYANGAEIQARRISQVGGWIDMPVPVWHFYEWEYRVKPEPRERWLLFRKDYGYLAGAYASEEEAHAARRGNSLPGECEIVHVREVLEETK